MRAQLAQNPQGLRLARGKTQVGDIALALGVRVFSKHHDGRIGPLPECALGAQHGLASTGGHAFIDAAIDGVAVGEVPVFIEAALPGEGPAAALLADMVSAIAGHQHLKVAPKRQQSALVLQQHQRFAHCLAGNPPMRRRPKRRRLARAGPQGRSGFGEQPEARLHAQDAGNGVINAADVQLAPLKRVKQALVNLAPVLRRHEHVDSGINRPGAGFAQIVMKMLKPVPVTDHESGEAHLPLEHIGEQVLVAVQLDPVEVIERRHHHLRAGGDGRHVGCAVNIAQFRFAAAGAALIHAAGGAAFADKVLRRGQYFHRAAQRQRRGVPLQAANDAGAVFAGDFRTFGIALVGSAPAVVPHHRERGREGPVNSGGGNFGGGCLAYGLDQLPITRGPEPDVVRKDRCAEHVRMPMNGVRAPHHGNAARGGGGFEECIGQRQPVAHACALVVAGRAAAAIEDRPEGVFGQFLRCHRRNLRLNHLRDLLPNGHAFQAAGHFLFHPLTGAAIKINRAPAIGPKHAFGRCVHVPGVPGAASDSRSTISQSKSRCSGRS